MAQYIQNAIIIIIIIKLNHILVKGKKQSSNNSQVEIYIESKNSQMCKYTQINIIKQKLHPNLSCCLYIVIVHNFIQWQVTWTRQVFSDKKK